MKVLKNILIIMAVLVLLVCIGAFAFRYFVTDRIMDRDGMENPDAQIIETIVEEAE